MKISLIYSIVITILILSCKDNSSKSGNDSPLKKENTLLITTGKAKMHFPKLTHSFGDVVRGDTLYITFPFYNNGTDNLIVDTAIVSCPCITARLSQSLVSPGDSARLDIIYHTDTKLGYDEKEITVVGKGFPKQSILRVNANIQAK